MAREGGTKPKYREVTAYAFHLSNDEIKEYKVRAKCRGSNGWITFGGEGSGWTLAQAETRARALRREVE